MGQKRIFSSSECPTEIRQLAGLGLKSQLSINFAYLSPATITYCKSQILNGYHTELRNTAINLIATVVERGGLNCWEGVVGFLVGQFEEAEEGVVESAVRAVGFLVEDWDRVFEQARYQEELDLMLTACSKLVHDVDRNEAIRANAIHILNMLIVLSTETVYNSTADYLNILIDLVKEDSLQIRLRAIHGITNILDFRLELILERWEEVCEVMLECLKVQDQVIALAAAEFWSGLAINRMEDDEGEQKRKQVIQKVLPAVAPVLLECCRYQTVDETLQRQSEEAEVNIYTEKYYKSGNISEIEYENEDEEDDGEFGALQSSATLRRAAAFGFEHFSYVAGKILYESLREKFQEYIENDQDLEGKEAAVLILGAIAEREGAYEFMVDSLEVIVPLLVKYLDWEGERVKATVCWTLSRFSEWIVGVGMEDVEVYLAKLLNLVQEESQCVREAAWSSIAELIDADPPKISHCLPKILETLKEVSESYQGASLLTFLDLVKCTAESYPDEIISTPNTENLLSIMTQKWSEIPDDSVTLCPLFECFQVCIKSIGLKISPHCLPITARCLRVISFVVSTISNPACTKPITPELAIRSLDLLTTIFQIFKGEICNFVETEEYFGVILEAMECKDVMVKQYVFQHLGYAIRFLKAEEYVGAILEIVCRSLEMYNTAERFKGRLVAMANNASWLVSQVVTRVSVEGTMEPLFIQLVKVVQSKTLNKGLAQNTALALGKLGLVDPQSGSEVLGEFFRPWCVSLRYLKNSPEKQNSFGGMWQMILLNPKAITEDLEFMIEAFVWFDGAPMELNQKFNEIIWSYKAAADEGNWEKFCSELDESVRENLAQKFDI